MRFPYKSFEVPIGGRREFLLKPIIPIWLFHKKSFVRLEALIDSGADFSVFHSEVAEILNIRWKKGMPHKFYSIIGSSGIVYFQRLKLKVGHLIQDIDCGFSNDVSEGNYCILGQEGFFEHFKITFDLSSEVIDIKPRK